MQIYTFMGRCSIYLYYGTTNNRQLDYFKHILSKDTNYLNVSYILRNKPSDLENLGDFGLHVAGYVVVLLNLELFSLFLSQYFRINYIFKVGSSSSKVH